MPDLERKERFTRDAFVQKLRLKGYHVEPDTVIARENVYRLNHTGYILVRTSRLYPPRGIYFFGLTASIFENFALIPNSVIAFVFADNGEALLIPAAWLWEQRHKLSADHKAFKLEIDKSLRLKVYKPSGGTVDLSAYRDGFKLLDHAPDIAQAEPQPKQVLAKHGQIQGMLIEIGNARGLDTFCPNKSPRYNGKALGDITTTNKLPEFPGLNNDIVRQIDVIWLEKSFPVHAFEVELTTGIWSGLVRLAELRRLNTVFHVITDSDERSFKRRIAGDIFEDIIARCHHANIEEITRLHAAQMALTGLKQKLAF